MFYILNVQVIIFEKKWQVLSLDVDLCKKNGINQVQTLSKLKVNTLWINNLA
jgi:hypothetical protein